MNLQVIEKEIQSISGNGPVLEELYKLLESGETIALVGAGASAGLWPLWNEFLQGFIAHSLKSGKINSDEAAFFQKEAPQTPLETAQQLRHKIGEQLYFEYLQETFDDKISPHTGGAFTLTHKVLLQLPIHNYLTLNYDAGLTNARATLYPKATTSYYFWDQEEARRIRDRNYKRQVLHAHGRYDRADSIILTLDDYRRAYDNRAFVRLLDDIFAFEKLLIVGFGMSDPYIKQLFNNISSDYEKSPLRHIAFIGLDDKDLQVTHLLRDRVEMVYGSRILFYPTHNHHQALTDWLTMLAEKYATAAGSQTAEEIQPLATPPQLKTALPDKYIHLPTDDANFKGRTQDFATLNRWANDPATRMISITGIGGQGKTALVGRWLKQERTPELVRRPVFFWSFYENLNVREFLEQVVKYCLPIIDHIDVITMRAGPKQSTREVIEPISFILRIVQQTHLLLVLDGLEVLQEEASSPSHGRINHPQLEQLLQLWPRYPHQSLMILTSRFQFPQLARFSGVGFHHLNLARLNHDDGLTLLQQLGVWGDNRQMGDYIEKLHGHPLALRVLASTVKRECLGEIDKFSGKTILAGDDEDPLGQKLERLLGFYEKQLKSGQKELLCIISLFKRPVETKSLISLLGNMRSLKKAPAAKANVTELENQLNLLIDDFLVEKTRAGITTHPIIRDYFSVRNEITGSRREVADFLQARPGAERPQNIEQVRDLVEAVQLLCGEGEFKDAEDLFESRLGAGDHGYDVFRDLPAVAEGLECHLAFVENKVRKKSSVAFHWSGVAYYNHLLGNLVEALRWWRKCLNIRRMKQIEEGEAAILYNISSIEMAMGKIRQALETVSKALKQTNETRILFNSNVEFADKAYYEFLLGLSSQAYIDFELAFIYFQKNFTDQQYLYSDAGNYQAEFFIRLEAWRKFEVVNVWNTLTCKNNNWNNDLAICHLLQGWCEICRGQLLQAENELAQAECILRPSAMVQETCRIDWVWALLAEAKGEYDKGLLRVNDALLTAADKGFRLWQADLLVLRGRLYLQKFDKEDKNDKELLERVGDDGHETLKIAEQTGYVWPKVEALELLAAYHQTRANLPAFNSQDEKDKAQSYANEAASIKKGLFLTEEQMQELKAQARQKFDKQIAGWEKEL